MSGLKVFLNFSFKVDLKLNMRSLDEKTNSDNQIEMSKI